MSSSKSTTKPDGRLAALVATSRNESTAIVRRTLGKTAVRLSKAGVLQKQRNSSGLMTQQQATLQQLIKTPFSQMRGFFFTLRGRPAHSSSGAAKGEGSIGATQLRRHLTAFTEEGFANVERLEPSRSRAIRARGVGPHHTLVGDEPASSCRSDALLKAKRRIFHEVRSHPASPSVKRLAPRIALVPAALVHRASLVLGQQTPLLATRGARMLPL